MDVEILGSSTSDFVVRVTDGGGTHEFNIQEVLVIPDDERLSGEVSRASALEHFWRQVAVDAEQQRKSFEEIEWAQYAAHIDRIARYYLRGTGDKNPTITDKRNAAILLFSSGTKRDMVTIQGAWNGYVQECKSVGLPPMELQLWTEDVMYLYDGDYEDAKARMLSLEYKADRLKAIAAAFNERSWAVKTMAADRRAALNSNS